MVDVPADGELIEAKAFANGVVASQRRAVEEGQVEGHKRLTYEWRLGLPAIQPLAFAVADARSVVDVFRQRDQRDVPPGKPEASGRRAGRLV